MRCLLLTASMLPLALAFNNPRQLVSSHHRRRSWSVAELTRARASPVDALTTMGWGVLGSGFALARNFRTEERTSR